MWFLPSFKGNLYRSWGSLWDIWASGVLTAWLRTGPGLRENKHYFSVVYLTFDFEGWDLVTLLHQTLCRHTVVNYLKVGGYAQSCWQKILGAFFPCVCQSVCVCAHRTQRQRACVPVVAISHLSGALLKLFQWTGCPLSTFHLCLHHFRCIKYLLDVSSKKSFHWKVGQWLWHQGQRRRKTCFSTQRCTICAFLRTGDDSDSPEDAKTSPILLLQ